MKKSGLKVKKKNIDEDEEFDPREYRKKLRKRRRR